MSWRKPNALAMTALAILTGRYFWLSVACQKWPATPGVIQSAVETTNTVERAPRQSTGAQEFNFTADIRYSYLVDGVAYTGSRISFRHCGRADGAARSAADLLARYAPGTAVDVHYKPANPAFSVLETQAYWPDALVPAAGAMAAAFCWMKFGKRRKSVA